MTPVKPDTLLLLFRVIIKDIITIHTAINS